MGDKLVTATSPPEHTATEIFDKMCGFYLSIGMNYTDYWDGDCDMVKYYRDKNKLDLERKNQELWLLGGYIYSAMVNVSPVMNAFSKKHEPFPYMEKPIELFPVAENPEEKEKRELEEKREKFAEFISQMNIGIKKRQEQKEVKKDA